MAGEGRESSRKACCQRSYSSRLTVLTLEVHGQRKRSQRRRFVKDPRLLRNRPHPILRIAPILRNGHCTAAVRTARLFEAREELTAHAVQRASEGARSLPWTSSSSQHRFELTTRAHGQVPPSFRCWEFHRFFGAFSLEYQREFRRKSGDTCPRSPEAKRTVDRWLHPFPIKTNLVLHPILTPFLALV